MRYEYFAVKLAEDYLKKGIVEGDDYPEMDLYIDQLVACLNKELELYRTGDDGPVTKAMVSNYTKHKMIPGPAGRKYGKDHLLFMTIVFYLKNSLSMDQIRKLMAPLLANYESEWDDTIDVAKMYKAFADFTREEEAGLPDRISQRIRDVKKLCSRYEAEDDTSELLTLIVSLIMEFYAELFIADVLLD